MQAAHNTAGKPLIPGYCLHGFKSAINTGIEEDEQIQTADHNDPEKVKGQGSKLIPGIPSFTKDLIKHTLCMLKKCLRDFFQFPDHRWCTLSLSGFSGCVTNTPFTY